MRKLKIFLKEGRTVITIKIEENPAEALSEMKKAPNDSFSVMTVRERGELLGLGIMRFFDKFVVLEEICMKDEFKSFDMEYGLVKSMLNAVDLKGVRYAVTNGFEDEKLAPALRFKSVGDFENEMPDFGAWKYYLNLDGYFVSNC